MAGKRYTIQLTEEERERLNHLIRGGKDTGPGGHPGPYPAQDS